VRMRWIAQSGFATLLLTPVAIAQSTKVDSQGWQYKDTPASAGAATTAAPAPPAEPPDERDKPGYLPGYRRQIGLGLSPHVPLAPMSLPGTMQPSFAAPNFGSGIGYEFHGYMQQPLRASFGERRGDPYRGQHKLTIHGDAIVPGANYGWFEHTMTVPTPWAHLGFTVGNRTVKATIQVGSWSPTESDEAAGYFRTPSKVWFNSAFLTYTPNVSPVILRITTGAYPERYGAMGRWTQGAYATSIIGTVFGAGATGTMELPFEGDWTAKFEAGFKGDFNRVPTGLFPNGSNEWARPWYGSTYAAHGHFGISYLGFEPTLHYIQAFSQDDRSDPYNDMETVQNEAARPHDGSLKILGADVRWDGKRFGYLYFGASHIVGDNTNRLSDTVTVINTGGGAVNMERFWGFNSQGTGKLTFVGGQYSVSLGTLLRYPADFGGDGPDLTLSIFGIFSKNQSADPNAHVDVKTPMGQDVRVARYKQALKYGVEGIYSALPWFAPSLRLDHVMMELGDSSKSFFVTSPKAVFRSDWSGRESLTVQYSYYAAGSHVRVNGDGRLVTPGSSQLPDKHFLTVYGTLWW
jgi:hypothetical protein